MTDPTNLEDPTPRRIATDIAEYKCHERGDSRPIAESHIQKHWHLADYLYRGGLRFQPDKGGSVRHIAITDALKTRYEEARWSLGHPATTDLWGALRNLLDAIDASIAERREGVSS